MTPITFDPSHITLPPYAPSDSHIKKVDNLMVEKFQTLLVESLIIFEFFSCGIVFSMSQTSMGNEHISIKDALAGIVKEGVRAYAEGIGRAMPDFRVVIERPKVKEFGDYATNVAMQLARVFKKSPHEIADGIKSNLPESPLVAEVSIAGPGFINFRLADAAGSTVLKTVLAQGEKFGRINIGGDKRVLVEFMSANPTGPLHIGHARNAILGDSIARILEAIGYNVTREYYYNDAGVQMKKLGESLRARYLQAQGIDAALPENGYRGEYMRDIAKSLVSERGDSLVSEKDVDVFTHYAADHIIGLIDEDMKALGINFDNWFSERSLHLDGKVEVALVLLKEKGMLYEKDGALWLRTQQFGDEKDRVVVKSDGEKTYLAPDLAYHKDKFERGFDLLVDVFGGDHHGYVPRLLAGVQALGFDAKKLHCIVFQMVTLLKEGERIKLSTRAGKFITLKDVIAELGADVVRFFFLMRSADSQMVFDWELAKDRSMNNPVFYVQYAHARCCSVFKKAEEREIVWRGADKSDLSLLTLKEEQEVLRVMVRYPEAVKVCAESFEPHHITLYLRELAGAFHTLFTMGTKNEDKRFLVPHKPELTQARLTLVAGVKQVLSNALRLIGIEPLERL